MFYRRISSLCTCALIFVLQRCKESSAQSCPQLIAPVYGAMQCTGNQINDSCMFQCNQGYMLTSSSSSIRQCVCLDVTNCFWDGQNAFCQLTTYVCPTPILSGNTYSLVDIAPNGAVAKVTVTPTIKANAGWTAIVIFTNSLAFGAKVTSFSASLSAISSDRKILTFRNRGHNVDISNRQQYSFTFLVQSMGLSPQSIRALVGFYDTPVLDGSCFLEVDPATTTQFTTTTTTITTTASPTATTTPPTVSTFLPVTTGLGSTGVPLGCQRIQYEIDNPGWNADNGWNFIFRYKVPVGDYENWTIKIEFSAEVKEVTAYDSVADGPYREGRVWFFTPRDWNRIIKNQQMDAIGMSVTSARSAPEGIAIICNNDVVPGIDITGEELSTASTTAPAARTTSLSTVTVMSTVAPTLDPNTPSGSLPTSPSQTIPNFKSSTDVTATDPFDLNELLHKSILFYEAQRSGKLPPNNRIPWRGDSGLNDGCVNSVCQVDLTGGLYDAGDFVKFGFPMAWSTTVLAWGMIEFQEGYKDAGEWGNAISMLQWAADYLVKAHISPNELYFQVGDPKVDHTNWGHPETMTMERPIFKVNTNNPGSEVAAETAAALAASSIVFKTIDKAYSDNLLNHAIQLYNFAQSYRGHYHISVPESSVGEFYRSYSGYNDELMWSAMWLYKATKAGKYLDDAIQQVNFVSRNEFSWDQKGPGALVLLSQERSEYKPDLLNGINFVMSKKKTPGGLVHFSDWGSNRYAANFALIALMAAKMDGITSNLGSACYKFGKEQIYKMLGLGDGSRSYVVGFGANSPLQPHHRASSCRAWNANPASQICDWSDRDANGPNPYTLYGALVGGPTSTGYYVDDRKAYVSNEVALDYNAGFQSAVAGLKYFQIAGKGP